MFRRLLFWCHLVAGACAGAVILTMSATGVLLTYEKQMLAWADDRAASIEVPASDGARASIRELIERIRTTSPGATVSSVTRRADPRSPITVALSDGRLLLVHPSSGAILREAPTGLRRLFRTATEWHRYLAGAGERRSIGKAITGACNLAFLFIVLSGIYLWCPRRFTRSAVVAVTVPRLRHASSKARDFNWHNALGFWAAAPLAIVVASATVISYPWASDLAYRLVGETPPPRQVGPQAPPARAMAIGASGRLERLDASWARAESQSPGWRSISLRLPNGGGPLVFTIDSGWGGEPHKRGTLTVDANTAEVVRWEPFDSFSRGRKLRTLLRFAHTGEVLGLPGQTLAGIVSAIACVMVVTGLSLACRRFLQWRRRQSREPLRRAA